MKTIQAALYKHLIITAYVGNLWDYDGNMYLKADLF